VYSPGKADEGDAAPNAREAASSDGGDALHLGAQRRARDTPKANPRVGLRTGSIGVTGLVGQLHYKEDIAEHFGIFPIDIYLQLRFFDLGYGVRVACVFRP
jgi:hypothetical protein